MIFRFSCIAILLLAYIQAAFPQVLKGTVKDTDGNPIPYATIYFREIRQGTVANSKGDYEIRIPEGKYTVIYQSLGYSPEERIVTITRSTFTLNITLQIQYYQIPEIRITASGEDPAYGIMRKVIGLAPYHLNQISYYKAEVYLKGTLVVNRIPRLLQQSIKAEARNRKGSGVNSNIIKEGETYLMESFNEIEFTAPDRYVQRVISSQSTFPEQNDQISPMDFIQASFYQPVIAGMAISPLSPNAFSHYRFKYDGVSVQGDYYIDRIQVIQRRKSQQLFEGTIYVIEDLWCLHSIDLVNENIAGKIRIQQLYTPVKDDIWMPVSYKFDMNISIIGVRADAGYGSSIKYRDLMVNPELRKPEPGKSVFANRKQIPVARPDSSTSRTREQIERILSKGELSSRDMVKLSSLLEKESRNSMPDSIRNSLELKERTTYIIEKDAGKKDSAFWAEIRPIPLSENEMQSLKLAGKLNPVLMVEKERVDTLKPAAGQIKQKRRTGYPGKILFGSTWSDTSGFSFGFDGLIRLKNINFNTVDGFIYGTGLNIGKRWRNSNSFNLYSDLRYAFSRETFMWRLNGQYRFNKMKQSSIYWQSGMISRDIGTAGGINPTLNSITSLFLKRNYLKLYDSRYVTAGFRQELVNGLYLDISSGFDNRKVLENTTDFAFIKSDREYTPNVPVNPYLELPPLSEIYNLKDNQQISFKLAFQFTPMQKYRISNNSKIPAGSEYPTFSLTYKHLINRFIQQDMIPEITLEHHDFLMLEIYQRKEIGAFNEYYWRLRSGGYFNNKGITFFDFSHFNPQPFPLLINNYEDAFRLKVYYSLSTPHLFAELHMKYTSPYILIKLLPILSNTLMRENLSISFYQSGSKSAYTELGYSISEILLLGEAGFYAGFNNFSFSSAGIRIVLKLN